MPRQRKLFLEEDRKIRQEVKRKGELEALRERKREERASMRESERQKKLNRKPKNEFYQCECGILLHWRVAYGHKSGCPQCHKPIPLSEIFE